MPEALPDRPSAFRRLTAAAIIFFALPSLFLVVYVYLAHAPLAAVLPHLYVVGTLAAGLAGIRLLVNILPVGAMTQRVVSACLICCVLLGFIVLYAGTFIGLKYWGRVASIRLASTYVKQLPDLLQTLGYPPLLLALVGIVALLLATFVTYMFLRRYDWVPSFRRQVSVPIHATATVSLLLTLFIGAFSLQLRQFGQQAEPLSLSLFPEQALRASQSHESDVFRIARLQREQDDARAAYVPATTKPYSNVILIVADALRADHLSIFNYPRPTSPHLLALQKQGYMRMATSAVTVCNESFCGLRGLVSSQYLADQAESPMTLHEVLKKHGYRVHLVFSGDHSNFYGIDQIYGPVDSFFDGTSQTTRYINDDRVLIDRLNAMPPSDGKPTMFQFHLMSSHALGQRFDETAEFGPGQNYTSMRFGSSIAAMPQLATNYYDRGIRQADQVIDTLLRQLQERNYLDDALVVITGDHGESLGERGLYSHTHSVWEEALRVPLIVLSFGKADPGDLETDRVISQIDIAPSVLFALGMPRPATFQGIPVQTSSKRRYVDFQQMHLLGLIDQGDAAHIYKHWIDTRSGEQFTFDLINDKSEKINITENVARTLRNEWREHLIDHASALPQHLQDNLRKITAR